MGGALGDAFGYLVEFDALAEIAAKYGPALLLDLSQAHGPALTPLLAHSKTSSRPSRV